MLCLSPISMRHLVIIIALTYTATSSPTSQPSNAPSAEPSGQPSFFPTYLSPLSLHSCKSGNNSNPVSFDVSHLGHANSTSPLYLSVSVFPTNYEVAGSQWARVVVNGEVIVPFCVPDASCGHEMFSCLVEYDVRKKVLPAEGGALRVTVSTTGVDAGPCDYHGSPLYTCVQLTDRPAATVSEEEEEDVTYRNIWVVVAIGSLVAVVMLAVGCHCNTSMKVEPSDKMSSYVIEDSAATLSNTTCNGDAAVSKPARSPSGAHRSSRPGDEVSTRRQKLQASGRFSQEEEDEEAPGRPLRSGGGEERRLETSLHQVRTVKKKVARKSYSFDGF